MKTEVQHTEKPFSDISDETLQIQEDILIAEPKIDDDTAELNGFSSEISSKINNFFEIRNSFLYEDVHENANSLEIYLSRTPSDGKNSMKTACSVNGTDKNYMNGGYEIETEGEKSDSVDSQKIYSSLKRYCSSVTSLSPTTIFNKTVDKKSANDLAIENVNTNVNNKYQSRFETQISDPFQLSFTNLCTNTLSKDSMIDRKYSVEGLPSSSQILTEDQKSVPLNKMPSVKNLKKRVKCLKEKTDTAFQNSNHMKRKESLAHISTCDAVVKEEPFFEEISPPHTFPKKDSSFKELMDKIRKREKQRHLRVSLTDFLSNCEHFKKQLKEKDDILCFNKAVTLSFSSDPNCGNENTLNIKKCKSYKSKSQSTVNQIIVPEETENKNSYSQQDDLEHLDCPEISDDNSIQLEIKPVSKKRKYVKRKNASKKKKTQNNKTNTSMKKTASPIQTTSNQTFKSTIWPKNEVGNDIDKKESRTNQSSITPQRHLNLLQLFDKVKRSSNSEKTFHSDHSVAKLFEKLNESKRVTPKKQIDKSSKYQELEEKSKRSLRQLNILKVESADQSDLEIPRTVERKRSSTGDDSESRLSSRSKRVTVSFEVTPPHSPNVKYSLRKGLRRKTSQEKNDNIQKTHEKKCITSLVSNILSPSSLKSEAKLDACSLIQVTEVKSLANCNRKNIQNITQKRLNHSAFTPLLDNPRNLVASEQSKSNKKSTKRKFCQISSADPLNLDDILNKKCISQTDEATSSTENVFPNKMFRESRRKRKKTSEDPNFYYTLKLPSKKRKNIECPEKKSEDKKNGETNLAVQLLPQDASHDEEKKIDSTICNFIEKIPSDQKPKYDFYPINPQCFMIYDQENNTTFLAVPVENSFNQRMIAPENRFAPLEMRAPLQITPMSNFPISQFINMAQNTVAHQNVTAITSHYATSLVPSQNVPASFQLQNVPSIAPSQNVPASFQLQNVPSIAPSQNVPASFQLQNVPSIAPSQNVPASFQLQNVPSIAPPQNIPVIIPSDTTAPIVPSQNFSSIITSQKMPQNASSVVVTQNTQTVQNALTVTNSQNAHVERSVNLTSVPPFYLSNCITPNRGAFALLKKTHLKKKKKRIPSSRTLQERKSEQFDFDWHLIQTTRNINKTDVYELAQKYFGKEVVNFTVREFCSDPIVRKGLSAQEIEYFQNSDLPSRIEYYFHSSSLDEPFIQVLKDFVHFFLKHVYSKIDGKFGEELKKIFFSEAYNKFSLSICILCSKFLPSDFDLTVNDITSALTLIGILVIFCEFKNLMKNSGISLKS